MNNFVFHNPTKIYFGRGQIARLSEAVPHEGKTLMLYGGGSIRQNGVYDQVVKALGSRNVIEFGGIEPNPTYETLMQAVEIVRHEGITFLLSVGGGSVLDGTKFIAAAAFMQQDPWDILARRIRPERALPIGAVLTLPATGSEMNHFAVISRKSTKEKLSFGHPLVFPVFSVLDPETTFSLPEQQVANGVVDAFVHVIEQYLTYPANAPLQDRFAESILQTLIEVGPKTYADPTDYESRATFMWAATLALNGLIKCGVPEDWSTHAIGHELTALYGIDHARTLAAVLPFLMRVQRDGKHAKLVQFARRVWNVQNADEETCIEEGIRRTAEFFESLGVPSDLTAYPEVEPDTPVIVADRLAARRGLPLGEHRDIDEERVRDILALSMAEAW